MLFRSNDTATTEIYTACYTLSLHDALPIRDLQTRGTAERLISQVTESAMKSLFSEWLGVDAPRALWQPAR